MSGFLTLNTAAALPPVTQAEAKAHLRVDGSDEDSLIDALVLAATSAVEEETGRALVTQTWDYAVSQPSGKVMLPVHPVASVSTLAYYDTDDAPQTLTVSDYYLFKGPDKAWLEPKDNVDWPEMKDRPDALTVTFVAGQAVAAVPQALKQAILLLVAHWYENREAVGKLTAAPLAYGHIISQHRLGWVA